MIRKPNIPTAILLVLTLSLFHIGIPLVSYFCPMGDTEASCCQIPQGNENHTTSITRQIHSCCDVYVGADRNTTPFRLIQYSHEYNPAHVVIADSPRSGEKDISGTNRIIPIDAGDNLAKPPLFVLHSSFLI